MCALAHDPVDLVPMFILYNDNKINCKYDNIFLARFYKNNSYELLKIKIGAKLMGHRRALVFNIEGRNNLSNI
jgi:hypothetical protein